MANRTNRNTVTEWPNGLGYNVGRIRVDSRGIETPRGEVWKLGNLARGVRTFNADGDAARYLRVEAGDPDHGNPVALVDRCEREGTVIA